MSVQAMSWAMSQRIVTDPPARHVLLCLANYAGADGSAAFPSVARLVEDTGLSERTIRGKLDLLLELGAIRPGNRAIVAAYIERADRRPLCFDLCMERGAAAAPGAERGAADDVNGVQLAPERGAGAAPKPSVNHPPKPSPSGGRASRLPADWVLPDDWRDWAATETGWPEERIRRVADKFRDYWHGVGGQRGRKLDWQATWRNWVRSDLERSQGAGGRPATMHGRIDTGARSTSEIVDEAQQLGFRTMEAP